MTSEHTLYNCEVISDYAHIVKMVHIVEFVQRLHNFLIKLFNIYTKATSQLLTKTISIQGVIISLGRSIVGVYRKEKKRGSVKSGYKMGGKWGFWLLGQFTF